MRAFCLSALVLAASCYAPPKAPVPLSGDLSQQLDLALQWVLTALDTTEGRLHEDWPRLLAGEAPSPTKGFARPIRHDPAWATSRTIQLHLDGVCSAPAADCFQSRSGFLIWTGFPASAQGDTAYVFAGFTVMLSPIPCRPLPGAGASSGRVAPSEEFFSHDWSLRLVRGADGLWRVDDPGLTGYSHNYGERCRNAG